MTKKGHRKVCVYEWGKEKRLKMGLQERENIILFYIDDGKIKLR